MEPITWPVLARFEPGMWPESSTIPIEPMLWVVAAVVALALGAWAFKQWPTWSKGWVPVRVYFQACDRRGVGLVARWRLWRLAKWADVSSPIVLLVSPTTMRHYSDKAISKMSPSKADQWSRRVNRWLAIWFTR